MKESFNKTTPEITEVVLRRLTGSQLKELGHSDNISQKGFHIVALERNADGDVLQAIVMDDVDERKFLYGEEEYYDSILEQAKELFDSKK